MIRRSLVFLLTQVLTAQLLPACASEQGNVIGSVRICTSDKKTFTINEKNKDLGLLKKVRKQERLRGDFWFWK